MLKVEVINGKIDKAIKQMRHKVNNTKLKQRLRDDKYYIKDSEKKRLKLSKAKYIQNKRRHEEED
jgi:ribosomal protein S21